MSIFGVTLSLTAEFIGVRQALQIDGILILFQLYALSQVIDHYTATRTTIVPTWVVGLERRVVAEPEPEWLYA